MPMSKQLDIAFHRVPCRRSTVTHDRAHQSLSAGSSKPRLAVTRNNPRNVTAATALILARVFGNSPDFWLNVQRRSDLWDVMNSPRERERIERAKPLGVAAA